MIVLVLFLALFIGINIRENIIVSLIGLVLLLAFAFFKRGKRIAVLSIIVSLMGVGLSFIRPTFVKEQYQGVVVEVKDNYYIFSSSFEKMYVYEPDHYHEIGDVLLINGDKEPLDFKRLEFEFDFKEYLNHKGVYSQLLVKDIEVKFSNPIRLHQFKKNFLNNFDENSKGIVGSILFASSEESDISSISRELHLARLISSSGIYLYFFYTLIRKLLLKFIKKDKIVDLIAIILFSPYLFFTFPKFIVLKFVIVRLLVYINTHKLNKRFSYLDILSVSGLFFLLFDYRLAYQDGFILSYFIPILSIFINGSFKFKNDFIKKMFLTLLIAVSFIPFTVKYYSEISIFSLPLQLVVTPIYIFIFVLSVLCLFGIPIFSFVGVVANLTTKALNFISPAMIKIYVSSYSPISFLLYEIIFVVFLYYLSIKLRPLKNLSLLGLLFSLTIHIIPLKYMFTDYVSFINVGQGDSTLIKYKNTTVLIDTGGNKYKDIATEVLIPYFKKNQIYRIDLLITTHDDFDHSGAVPSLIENFTVREYVKDYTLFPINKNGLVLTNYNIYPDLWKEENDESLVIGFNVNSYNYLIMGDAPKKIENAIIKDNKYIPCDILKVGHHGSNTSTSDAFIKYLKPTVGVISCGKDNYYGHPHNVVIAILKKYGVSIRRTDLEGTITF